MDVVVRITAIGLAASLGALVLKRAGRDDIAAVIGIAGLLMTMLIVVRLVQEFFTSVESVLGMFWQ